MSLTEIKNDFYLIKKNLSHDKQKYYHLKSIDCFLKNFYLIKDYEKKIIVLNSLSSCLKYYRENNITDVKKSLEMFNLYLKHVGVIYEEEAGFSIFIKSWLLFLYILVANLLIYFFISNILFFTVINLIFLFYIFYLAKKFKNNQLYSFLW